MNQANKALAILLILMSTNALAAGYYTPADAAPATATQTAEQIVQSLAEKVNGKIAKTAATGSMAPTIVSGDLVVYVPVTDYKTITVGDIVIFSAEIEGTSNKQSLFMHRVVKIDGFHRLYTKGDHNKDTDEGNVWGNSLKARVVYIVNGQTGQVTDLTR